MLEFLSQPWPWYVAGPLIGLVVPLLLLLDARFFGVSATFRDLCAALVPGRLEFLRYDWRRSGLWNLTFVAGVALGGLIASRWLLGADHVVALSEATVGDLQALGVDTLSGLVPSRILSWPALLTVPGLAAVVVGGFLVGFGARYAGGCTSGHAITGLALGQLPSLIAVVGFFAGGLFVTHLLLPLLF